MNHEGPLSHAELKRRILRIIPKEPGAIGFNEIWSKLGKDVVHQQTVSRIMKALNDDELVAISLEIVKGKPERRYSRPAMKIVTSQALAIGFLERFVTDSVSVISKMKREKRLELLDMIVHILFCELAIDRLLEAELSMEKISSRRVETTEWEQSRLKDFWHIMSLLNHLRTLSEDSVDGALRGRRRLERVEQTRQIRRLVAMIRRHRSKYKPALPCYFQKLK